MTTFLIWMSSGCSKPEKLEDRKQALMQIARDHQFAKQAGEAALTNAGKYTSAGSSSYWLYVAMACGNDTSGYDGASIGDKVALGRMAELAKRFADGAKADELFRLARSGRAQDALQQALMVSGVPGERDWQKTADILESHLKNNPNLTISEGKAIDEMIASIQSFIKERSRLFAKSS
ncbi:MAG: hypothetical protein HGB08_00655 [Candidatus Moranbacteria bacterium]|nr:hypothetical protein [Candidatus Moranbacteria bacterium]